MVSPESERPVPGDQVLPGPSVDRVVDGPSLTERVKESLPAVIGFGVPFILVFFLAIEAGGYDIVLRSEAGIVIWWTVMLGVVVGMLPMTRVTRAGWIGLGVLAAIVFWTALGTFTWTETTERGMVEFSRVAMLLGVFSLFVLTQGKEGLRRSVSGVGVAVALIALIALTDRFAHGLLPIGANEILPEDYPRARLNFPLEYWNGLAALLAIGLSPLLWIATAGKTIWGRAAAAGVLPLIVLAAYMTASRGGIVATAFALAALLILFPRRLLLIFNMVVPVIASIVLIVLINRRPELRDLISGDTADSQSTQMFWICVLAFFAVAAVQLFLVRLVDRGSLKIPVGSYAAARWTGIVAALAVVLLVAGGLATGYFGDKWSEFKQVQDGTTVDRLGSLNSSERYFLWDSSLEAASSEKLTGIGPGAFEYWWSREGRGLQFVRDAHSLYLESFAEMGPIGLLLSLALVFGPIIFSGLLAVRSRSMEQRALLAAATAGMVAFALAAAVDWAWEMTVLPVAFLALAAAALGPDAQNRFRNEDEAFRMTPLDLKKRIFVGIGAVVLIVVIAIPMISTQKVRTSQDLVRSGDLQKAADEARAASDIEPYAAAPKIQEAQVQQLLGNDREAIDLARQATRDEGGNWRNWYVLAQVLAETSPEAAATAARHALRLNPKSAALKSEVQDLTE